MNCGHCGSKIKLYAGKPLYRTCDAYVCSPACSRERVNVISILDPNLIHSSEWEKTNTKTPPPSLSRKYSYTGLNSLNVTNDITKKQYYVKSNNTEDTEVIDEDYRLLAQNEIEEEKDTKKEKQCNSKLNIILNNISHGIATIVITVIALWGFIVSS